MNIQELTFILLLLRLGSMTFIIMVLVKQWKLFKRPLTPNDSDYTPASIARLKHYRLTLFVLALCILAGNLYPAFLDIAAQFIDTGRPEKVGITGVFYTLDNAATALVSSFLIWWLYRLSASENQLTDAALRREVGKS